MGFCFDFEFCIDTCTASSGYKCETVENIALRKKTKASSVFDTQAYHATQNVVDGDLATLFASKYGQYNWFLIDLLGEYEIYSLVMYFRRDTGKKYSTIRIGNNEDVIEENKVCVEDEDYSKIPVKTEIFCRHGAMRGRYVYNIQDRQGEPDWPLEFMELQVFGEAI